MNDCPNADVRDSLPDLLHGHLDGATRAMVESHVAGCADCRAELALLGSVRASTVRTPVLNLSAVAAAVPAYRAPVRRSWVGWRTAAAVTLIVAAGSSIIVTQRIGSRQSDSVGMVTPSVVPVQDAPSGAVVGPVAVTPAVAAPPTASAPTVQPIPKTAAPVERELAMSGGSLTDLSDRELASLLKDIESLDAVPSTDVESVPISPIAPRRSTP
ncbi:MAG: zf-HC2 domain-containing protein [Gemmatimonadaceae bacterium]